MAQPDTTMYGYIDSVNISKPEIQAWALIKPGIGYLNYDDEKPGFIVVEFIIDNKGKTSDYRIIKTFGPSYNKNALKLVKKSVWTPAVNNGQQVKSSVRVNIEFMVKKY